MSGTRWIESAGGPLIALPETLRDRWRGIENDDYDTACTVEDYLGVVARPWGNVLVLNDEPLSTAIVAAPNELLLVRWVCAPDEEALLTTVRQRLASAPPVETLAV